MQPRLAPSLLAHVLAHEIGHLLEKIDYHTGIGIMKARWGDADYSRTIDMPFSFGARDAELRAAGLASR